MICDLLHKENYPRPDWIRPLWLPLDGEWQFDFDDDDKGLTERWQEPAHALNRTIRVPYCYQCEMSGIGETAQHDVLWYRRSFALPPEMRGKRVFARFLAVDFECRVYVNGQLAGTHEGGYSPFSVELTSLLREGENDLCLRVTDTWDCTQPRGKQMWKAAPYECWYTPVSGIWQSVYLEAVGDVAVQYAHIIPDIDAGTATVELLLDRHPTAPVEAEFVVRLEGREVLRQSARLSQRNCRVIFDMLDDRNRDGFQTWSPERPALYDVSIRLGEQDEVYTYFGMRKVEVVDGHVMLNNRPIYQRLVLDQGYWDESLLTPPSQQALIDDIQWTKRFGFNGARKHQKVEDPRYYYWADKLGLLVWGEVPSTYHFSRESVLHTSELLAAFIDRDFNHPCLITWVPLNESWGVNRIYTDARMQAASRMYYQQCKALDGTRLVSCNDGWEQTETDVCALHDYADDGAVMAGHFATREQVEQHFCDYRPTYARGAKPTGKEAFLVTEYGGIAFEEGDEENWGYHRKVRTMDAFFERYQGVTDAIRALPYCEGYCYTQLTDVQQETNGLLTPDRKPKVDPERFAALNRNPDTRYN